MQSQMTSKLHILENHIKMMIREAIHDDAEQMITHVQRLEAETDSNIPLVPGEFQITVEEERKMIERYTSSDNSIFLVAEVDGRIVGVLNCNGGKRQASRHTVVLGMSVAKEWRSKGIGKAMMATAIEWAKGTGIVTRIELAVFARNTVAIRMYKKFGFEEEGHRRRAFYQDGQYIDDVLMSLLL